MDAGPIVFWEGALGVLGELRVLGVLREPPPKVPNLPKIPKWWSSRLCFGRGRIESFGRVGKNPSQISQSSQNSQIDGRAGCVWGWAVERIESPLNDSHLTAAGLERRQQPRADRREVVAIEDCRDWWAMWRKVLFRHNRPSNTNICVANNKRPSTSLPRRHKPSESLSDAQKNNEASLSQREVWRECKYSCGVSALQK